RRCSIISSIGPGPPCPPSRGPPCPAAWPHRFTPKRAHRMPPTIPSEQPTMKAARIPITSPRLPFITRPPAARPSPAPAPHAPPSPCASAVRRDARLGGRRAEHAPRLDAALSQQRIHERRALRRGGSRRARDEREG